MKVGFIGLGNVGGKLVGNLLRNHYDLCVRDLDQTLAQPFLDKGADWAASPKALAVLATLGRRVLHTGPIGSTSVLKVLTNYLATINLCSLAEALTVVSKAGMDLNTAYEAIRISSGNSFVHETESQVILNGSRDISFTMDLVVKDVVCLMPWLKKWVCL